MSVVDGVRDFSVIVLGATGFTGQLVCHNISAKYGVSGARAVYKYSVLDL